MWLVRQGGAMRIPIITSLLNSLQAEDSFFQRLKSKGGFPWAAGICLSILVGVLLVDAKLWRSTPDHIEPVIRISVLDWIQSRSHHSQAEKIIEGKARGDLIHTLKMAINADRGNPSLNRQYLQALIKHARKRGHIEEAIRSIQWTLELTRTNALDLQLACDVFEHYHLDALRLETIQNFQGARTPAIEKAYLEALFSNHRLDDVKNCLAAAGSAGTTDPELRLYHAAMLDVSDAGSPARDSRALLDQAAEVERTAELASRLQLYLAESEKNLPLFESAFARLIHRFDDTPRDHIRYWSLLKDTGHLAKAQDAAKAYVFRPFTTEEVIQIANAFTKLELKSLAYQYLVNYADEFDLSESNRIAQASILIENEDWNKLHRLALSIRSQEDASSGGLSYSYFLQGRALIGENREEEAEKAFARIPEFSMAESEFAFFVGSNLLALGYPQHASKILSQERDRYRNSIIYWELMKNVARALDQANQMILATENLCRLDPENRSYLKDTITLIIVQRHRTDEALALTTEALERYPNDPAIRLNHGYALLLNDRLPDAISLLSSIEEADLEIEDRHRFFLAWMEFHFRSKDYNEAWRTGRQVAPKKLFPQERKQFQSMWEQLQSEDPTGLQPNLSQVKS